MKNVIASTVMLVVSIVAGLAGLAGNQPGLLMVVFCSWSFIVGWFSIAWWKFLFGSGRRLAWIEADPQQATANGRNRQIRRLKEEQPL